MKYTWGDGANDEIVLFPEDGSIPPGRIKTLKTFGLGFLYFLAYPRDSELDSNLIHRSMRSAGRELLEMLGIAPEDVTNNSKLEVM